MSAVIPRGTPLSVVESVVPFRSLSGCTKLSTTRLTEGLPSPRSMSQRFIEPSSHCSLLRATSRSRVRRPTPGAPGKSRPMPFGSPAAGARRMAPVSRCSLLATVLAVRIPEVGEGFVDAVAVGRRSRRADVQGGTRPVEDRAEAEPDAERKEERERQEEAEPARVEHGPERGHRHLRADREEPGHGDVADPTQEGLGQSARLPAEDRSRDPGDQAPDDAEPELDDQG